MIRRSVAIGLGKLSTKMKVDTYVQEILPLLKNLVNDDQDSVRLLCIESIVDISASFSRDLNKANIIPILIHMIRDRAWKIRMMISKNFGKIAEAMSTEIADNSLINIFSSLLSDPEGEVRCSATQNFVSFLKQVSKSKYPVMVPHLQELVKDSLPLVRVAAYEIVTLISEHLPKTEVKEKLIDGLISSFKTEKDNEVKIEMGRALTSCGLAMSTDFFTKVTNSDLTSLLKERSWRVRKEIYTMIVTLSVNSKSSQLFEVNFQEHFLTYLTDQAYQVRMHGNSLLPVNKYNLDSSQDRAYHLGHKCPDTKTTEDEK